MTIDGGWAWFWIGAWTVFWAGLFGAVSYRWGRWDERQKQSVDNPSRDA